MTWYIMNNFTITDFKVVAREQIPETTGRGVIIHQYANRRCMEIIFSTKDLSIKYFQQGINMDNELIYGWPAVQYDGIVIKLQLKGLPFWSTEELTAKLSQLEQYGEVLESDIYKSLDWFEGKGYAYIVPTDNTTTNLTHVIDSETDALFYVTYASMPPHFKYCKSLDHMIMKCQKRLEQPVRRCWTCDQQSHLYRKSPEKLNKVPLHLINVLAENSPLTPPLRTLFTTMTVPNQLPSLALNL
ncbi:hypothetical protein K501DRAFT_276919 [Backusella circina FSU 941]|nr:hypothetical protein K501DRAFT_276919 [Backusella circina FSU 941]